MCPCSCLSIGRTDLNRNLQTTTTAHTHTHAQTSQHTYQYIHQYTFPRRTSFTWYVQKDGNTIPSAHYFCYYLLLLMMMIIMMIWSLSRFLLLFLLYISVITTFWSATCYKTKPWLIVGEMEKDQLRSSLLFCLSIVNSPLCTRHS